MPTQNYKKPLIQDCRHINRLKKCQSEVMKARGKVAAANTKLNKKKSRDKDYGITSVANDETPISCIPCKKKTCMQSSLRC